VSKERLLCSSSQTQRTPREPIPAWQFTPQEHKFDVGHVFVICRVFSHPKAALGSTAASTLYRPARPCRVAPTPLVNYRTVLSRCTVVCSLYTVPVPTQTIVSSSRA
jgi:hypothetical protein